MNKTWRRSSHDLLAGCDRGGTIHADGTELWHRQRAARSPHVLLLFTYVVHNAVHRKISRPTVRTRGRTNQCYHAHTCYTPPLPLDSAAPRRTPRRASVQLMICMTTKRYCYTTVSQYSTVTVDLWPYDVQIPLQAMYGHHPYTCNM